MIATTAAAIAIIYRLTSTELDFGPYWPELLSLAAALLATSWFYHSIRPSPVLSAAAETAVQLVAIAALAAFLNFGLVVAGAGFPYRDATLSHWDQALGFDWRAYVSFVDRHPLIQPVLKICYLSINASYPTVLLVLILSGQRGRFERFMAVLWISLMVTMAIFFFVPARAAYVYYGVSLHDLETLSPTFLVNRFEPLLETMRSAGPHVVRVDDLEGLVTFPSFHMEAAILFTWAVWTVRWARWPMLMVNLLMVVAIPVEGAHYAVDAVAGAVIAAAAIITVEALHRRWSTETKDQPFV
jgi:hypothetical protein